MGIDLQQIIACPATDRRSACRRRAPAWAQAYPSRPIRLIVNFAPGGTGDISARIIGSQLAIELGQSVVVENRAGAGGTIGARDVVNAAPDGYTLTVGQTPEIAINPYFMKDVGYDPLKDLQPIALAGVVPLALVVPAEIALLDRGRMGRGLARQQPMTFASAGVGTPGHLAGELLKLKLDSKLVHVPYKGAGPALNDVAAGQVDFYFPAYPAPCRCAGRQDQALGGVDHQALSRQRPICRPSPKPPASQISILRCGSASSVRTACRWTSRRSSTPRSTRSSLNRRSSAG